MTWGLLRGDAKVAYEYGYNSDGVRVWKRDVFNQREYRYVCRIGCGDVPMRVYNRAIGSERWASVEDYLETPPIVGYSNYGGTFGDYRFLVGHWLLSFSVAAGDFIYLDAFGATPIVVEPRHVVPPLYLYQDDGAPFSLAALKAIIIGGLVLIGIALCVGCTSRIPPPRLLGGDDFFCIVTTDASHAPIVVALWGSWEQLRRLLTPSLEALLRHVK